MKMVKNIQKDIDAKKREAMLLLGNKTMSYSKIAQKLGIHRNTLYEWRQDKDFLNGVRSISENLLQEATLKATNTMIDLLDAKSELVRFQAAKEIMDKNEMTRKDKLAIKKLEKEIDRGDESTTETNLADALIKLAGGNSDT